MRPARTIHRHTHTSAPVASTGSQRNELTGRQKCALYALVIALYVGALFGAQAFSDSYFASEAAPVAPPAVSPEGPHAGSRTAGIRPAVAVPPSAVSPRVGAAVPDAQVEYSPACAMFRLTAVKALAGEFGALKPWQKRAYQRGLASPASARSARVMLTTYGPWDPGHYKGSVESAAANELPQGTMIWIPYPSHLRAISTTGAHSNDREARERGDECWTDLWTPYKGWHGLQNTKWDQAIVIIR